jgi:hypothetical protein
VHETPHAVQPHRFPSSRSIFFGLLLVNLAFLAWANLIDVPVEAPAPSPDPHLPRLVLASETAQATAHATARPAAQTKTAIVSAESEDARPVPVAPPAHCVTVGPFTDGARASRAAQLLRDRGFKPRERGEGEARQGFWVYVGGLANEKQQNDVIQRLEHSGIQDAQAMAESEQGRRVSVGLFSERDGAERRARAVKALGLTPEISERKQTAAAFWLDVDLNTSTQTLPTDGLLSLQEAGARLEIHECPASQAPQPGSVPPATPDGSTRGNPTPADARPAKAAPVAGVGPRGH